MGAGTVLSPEHLDAAADAGASFVVSPTLDPEVARRAADRGLGWSPRRSRVNRETPRRGT
ncbi:hypothetical protein [Pseudonocardia nigra]|uniref:hypothetical protein n=1 Tax=Pseudonocardia nigra TaxID=1921578 RepID=UPI00355618EE